MFLSPSDIRIGKRYRKDVDIGINDLCRSIETLGQLQPVIVDTDRNLIVGARRHRACELLNREVWVEEVDGLDDLTERIKAEQDENTCRLPFTPSEAVAIGKAILAAEKPKAAERKKATQAKPGEKVGAGSENFSAPTSPSRAVEVAASAVGMSRPTFEHAELVYDEAAKPDALPEVVEAARKMDETGKVDPAYKAVLKATRKTAKKTASTSQLPQLLKAWNESFMAFKTLAMEIAVSDKANCHSLASQLRSLADEIDSQV